MGDQPTLVDASNNDICETATMIEYSILECKTNAGVMTSGLLRVKDTETGIAYDGDDCLQCEYGTLSEGLAPTWTSVSTSDNKNVSFEGANMYPYGSYCAVYFLGVPSDSCSLTATTVTATFNDGIPVSEAIMTPVVELIRCSTWSEATICTSPTDTFYAMNKEVVAAPVPVEGSETGLSNPFSMTNDDGSVLSCSFAGGCVQTIDAKGLSLNVKEGRAEVNICGRPCIMSDVDSDSDTFGCEVPSIQSLGSIN